ncbi:MAG TPA: T9SS type A sorting domain-containing protein [Paludibacter sp.]
MKKITFLLSVLGLSMAMSAQTKITFEDAVIGSTGGATAMWGAGTVDVVANTYTTGNPSAKALHVLNTNYLPVYFGNIPLPAGAETMYSKIRVKYLIIGGTDTDYPKLEIFSSPNSTTAGATEKIGEVAWAGLWGIAEIGVWKTVEFAFANATLKPVPAGNLVLKLSKISCEYLIDDVELVPIPVATPIITVNDFESNTIGDVLSMRRYGATDASAIVEANPTDAANKAVHILATNWDSGLKQNVVLPAGKILANYSKLSFDIYLNNITGTDNGYKNIEIWVDNTKVFDVSNGAGTANAWVTKEYTLDNLAGANAFVLDFGLNTNNANYYIDNVKLTEKLSTGLTNSNKNSFQVYCADNTIQLGQLVNQANVFDVNGRLLVSAKNTSVVNVSNFSRGIYIVKAFVNGQTYMSKFTK